jgi:benzoylformate decarboxylase
VVVVLGAPAFTFHVHADGPVVEDGTTLFQLVDDPAQAAWAPAGTSVLTTLRSGVARLLESLPAGQRPPAAGRGPRPSVAVSSPMTGDYVLHVLAGLLPPDAMVVEEAPSHRNAMHEHLPIRRVGGFAAGASGGLGWALPAAVGHALADPTRRVLCLVGDGSSLYSIQALWTAAQHELPLTVLVLNNGGYGALKALGLAMGVERPPGVDLPGLDLCALARGFGCDAARIETADELPDALRHALARTGPMVLDLAVDAAIERLY